VHVICLVKECGSVNSLYEFVPGQILSRTSIELLSLLFSLWFILVIKQVVISFFLISHFDEYLCCSAVLWVLQNNDPNLIYF